MVCCWSHIQIHYNNHEINVNIKTQCFDVVIIDNWLFLAFEWLWSNKKLWFLKSKIMKTMLFLAEFGNLLSQLSILITTKINFWSLKHQISVLANNKLNYCFHDLCSLFQWIFLLVKQIDSLLSLKFYLFSNLKMFI